MFQKRGLRLGVGVVAVTIGLLVAAPAFAAGAGGSGPSVKITSPTSGEKGYPTCKFPGNVTNGCSLGITVKGAPDSTELAVDECNSNVTTGDQDACSMTPGSKPGEVDLVESNAKGKASVKDYPVLVSSKKMQGDAYCAKGDTCYIIVATLSGTEIGSPAAFTAG
jgi:hypothetical protein